MMLKRWGVGLPDLKSLSAPDVIQEPPSLLGLAISMDISLSGAKKLFVATGRGLW
jgi:hypothetical protein